MNNNTRRYLLLAGLFFCVATTLPLGGLLRADEYVSIAESGVSLYAAPNPQSEALFQLPLGYPLAVLERQEQWLRVSDYQQDKGWVRQDMVNNAPNVIVKVKECKLRQAPNSGAPLLAKATKEVILLKLGQEGEWLYVAHPNLEGWVHQDLVWP